MTSRDVRHSILADLRVLLSLHARGKMERGLLGYQTPNVKKMEISKKRSRTYLISDTHGGFE
jgi:hypothetical protein